MLKGIEQGVGQVGFLNLTKYLPAVTLSVKNQRDVAGCCDSERNTPSGFVGCWIIGLVVVLEIRPAVWLSWSRDSGNDCLVLSK